MEYLFIVEIIPNESQGRYIDSSFCARVSLSMELLFHFSDTHNSERMMWIYKVPIHT